MFGRKPGLEVLRDGEELAQVAASLFAKLAIASVKSQSRFTVVLSGGNTPRPLYERLAVAHFAKDLPWDKIHFFWGDERNVPSDSFESNFHMAWTAMLSPLSISEKNIHRVRTELQSPTAVAEDYENTLRSFFRLKYASERPRFDLVLLGLGSDGHTASLFPDGQPSTAITQEDPNRLVIASWVPHLNEYRISMTPTAFNQADQVIFLASGSEKAEITARVMEANELGVSYPAQAIRPVNGKITWLIDRGAASLLKCYTQQDRRK